MRKRTLYWILAALFAASAIYAPFDDNRDSGLPLTIVTIIALVALAVGFAMAARKVDPEARFKKKPKSVTKMKSKPVKAKDLMVDNYTSIDLETTGFSPSDDRIVEIGAIRVRNGRPVKRYSQLINPQRPLPEEITRLNGLTDADLRNQPTVDQVLPDFIRFIGNDTLIGHNINEFDAAFLLANTTRLGMRHIGNKTIDTRPLPRRAETPPCRHHPPIRHRTNGKPSRGRRRTPNRTMLRNHESLHEGQRNQITLIQEQNRPGARRVTGAVSCLGLDPPDTGFIA